MISLGEDIDMLCEELQELILNRPSNQATELDELQDSCTIVDSNDVVTLSDDDYFGV